MSCGPVGTPTFRSTGTWTWTTGARPAKPSGRRPGPPDGRGGRRDRLPLPHRRPRRPRRPEVRQRHRVHPRRREAPQRRHPGRRRRPAPQLRRRLPPHPRRPRRPARGRAAVTPPIGAVDWDHYDVRQRYRRPPLVVRVDDATTWHPWVLLDCTVPAEPDEVIHNHVVGVYSTRRRAWRGFLRLLIEVDGRPLATLHQLTWRIFPGGWEAWDDDLWGEPEAPRYALTWGGVDDRRASEADP